ncbi:hypothetical protein [Aquipuribacter hungaricus]|uniref:hypothetical protein n=1 Tax=Aquipuribacter hungaricus TaxID=545624 RepID=UPI0030ED064E
MNHHPAEDLRDVLRTTVPEPPHHLDPDRVMHAAQAGRRRRRAVASAAATAMVIAVATGIATGLPGTEDASGVAGPASTAPSVDPSPTTAESPRTAPAAAREPATIPRDGWYLTVSVDRPTREQEREAAHAALRTALSGGYPDAQVVPNPGSYCPEPCTVALADPASLPTLVLQAVPGPDVTDPATTDEAVIAFQRDVAEPAEAAAEAIGLNVDSVVLRWLPFSDIYSEPDPAGYPPGDPATDVGDAIGRAGAVEIARGAGAGSVDPAVAAEAPVHAVLTTMGEVDAATGGSGQVPPGRLVWVATLMAETPMPDNHRSTTPTYGESRTSVIDASTGFIITGIVGPPYVSPDDELIWQ